MRRNMPPPSTARSAMRWVRAGCSRATRRPTRWTRPIRKRPSARSPAAGSCACAAPVHSAEPSRQAAGLMPALVGELDIGRTGEAVLGGEHRALHRQRHLADRHLLPVALLAGLGLVASRFGLSAIPAYLLAGLLLALLLRRAPVRAKHAHPRLRPRPPLRRQRRRHSCRPSSGLGRSRLLRAGRRQP